MIILTSVISSLVLTTVAQARDSISIAGSSTVLPFARIIAE
jgi:ABC-type phosphate transport system substrate-binding protein